MQNIRTDLALEAHEMSRKNARKAGQIDGVVSEVTEHGSVTVTSVKITNQNGARELNKAVGNYITIEAADLKYSRETYKSVCRIISEEIRKMAGHENPLTLIVGLGNRDITPDALGTRVVSNLIITEHIKNNVKEFQNINGVCAVAPGVLGTTGIETLEIIKGIVSRVKPDLIIAADALAAADIRRVNTTIQIADTGIQPGAGVGNNREGLNEETLGVKVIAIGVPTVIDASTISKVKIPEEIAPLIVTTKDIDAVIDRMAKAVANGINMALQNNLSLADIESLTG